ncbi:MAG TPA: GNAT family N-acetyltransferase [Saprospiraceae bacterium]|nr:GNAT family N-acetyltransferase [Saprospiraceae bacterium]HND88882.1 GNAT family N-acetyltransferase [Saprospiraceae bacterium]
MPTLHYTTVSSSEEVSQILGLQARNHPSVLSADQMADQGFVTVQHDPAVLLRMNQVAPSVIAKAGGQVVGYALVMPRSFAPQVPILQPMFALLDTLSWRGAPLFEQTRWFVMGQICVAEDYRGQGVFDGLYRTMREVCRADYDFTVTEVAERNTRSMRAHERVGFQTLHRYPDPGAGEDWRVVVLDF